VTIVAMRHSLGISDSALGFFIRRRKKNYHPGRMTVQAMMKVLKIQTRQIHEVIRLCPPHKERDDGSELPKNQEVHCNR
jgi:hypothetical protein